MLIENKLHGPRTAANSRAPTRPGSPISNGQATFASASALNGGNGAFTPSNGYGLHNGSSGSNGAGLESFLKSRAPSVGPEGMSFTGFQTPGGGGYGFDPTLGGAFPGGLGDATAPFSFGGPGGELSAMGGDGAGGGAAFDSLMVDDVLSANGFWSSMLMVRLSLVSTPVEGADPLSFYSPVSEALLPVFLADPERKSSLPLPQTLTSVRC